MPPLGGEHHYRAPDYETLVDSPIVAGNPAVHEFTVEGKPHFLVDVEEDGVFDGDRAAQRPGRIVRQDAKLWRGLPYDKYLFLNMLTGGGGGMEHSNSTALMSDRWSTRTPRNYLRWLDLASHEFFHTWNVKRLRPAEFTPGEYETEPYTTSLGIAEGFTSYYGPLMVHRAGLSTERGAARQSLAQHSRAADHSRPPRPVALACPPSIPGSSSTVPMRTP